MTTGAAMMKTKAHTLYWEVTKYWNIGNTNTANMIKSLNWLAHILKEKGCQYPNAKPIQVSLLVLLLNTSP